MQYVIQNNTGMPQWTNKVEVGGKNQIWVHSLLKGGWLVNGDDIW
jgi:hypothetical protein